MSKHYNPALSVLALIAVAAGCSPKQAQEANKEQVQIANPASEYCASQGGKTDIETSADGGQVGICVLKDGTRIDEWELYRRDHPQAPADSSNS